MRLELPIFLKGSLIDIETWDDFITCYGVISGNELVQVIAESDEELDQFNSLVYQAVRKLERPLYAFNKSFEESFLGLEIDEEINTHRYEKKWKSIPFIAGVPDPFKGEGYRCIEAWRSRDKKRNLPKILTHNKTSGS